jgi:hypothetical protein
MNVLLKTDADLGLCRVRIGDRVRARLQASRLDLQLAGGASPESSVILALHAARLHEPLHRKDLADSLWRIAAATERPARLKAPLCRTAIRQAHRELEAVAARLAGAGPVNVRGVATVRRLLADGGGPLYRRSAPERLQSELRGVLAALDSFE